MNVLSLFDGISCAYEGLNRAGIKVANYYACEIEKHAITISDKRHPNIQRPTNDVRELRADLVPSIDLLIGGSPCQDLSIAKKGREGLEGNRSSLFWQYARIKNELKPKYFILENVASMPQKDRDIITKEMGVEPVMFNASLVSAQCRKRLFWTNIKFELPVDRGILLKDILQPDAEVDERMVVKGKAYCLTASYNGAVEKNSVERKQRTMVLSKREEDALRDVNDKARCMLSSMYKGSENNGTTLVNTGLCEVKGASLRGRLQEDGTWKKNLDIRKDEKASALTTMGTSDLALLQTQKGCIRKLTPIECERLQGLPDNYTEGVANTNRYKVLGNAFNVDVIAHILSSLKTNVPNPVAAEDQEAPRYV